jgi:large subunit ribosomal protein L10
MLTRTQKQEQVDELREKFAKATSLIVADYRGIDVESINQLRSQLKSGDDPNAFEYRVTKNSLLRRAAEGLPVAEALGHFEGPSAIALSYDDPIGLAKILVGFAKEHEVFEIKGGVIDGAAMDSAAIAELATLPSLDELRGMLVGLFQAPAQKLVQVLVAPASQLARVADARRAQLEESGAASE